MSLIKMKFYPIYLLLLISSLFLNENIWAKPIPNEKPTDIDYVFIQTAKNGEIQLTPSAGIYKLILREVDPWVTYLSSSPRKRITGFMDMKEFIKIWEQNKIINKDTEKLNSAMVAVQMQNNQSMRLAIALKNPIYDEATHTITFSMEELNGAKTHPILKEILFKHVALFIDDVCISCVLK